MPHPRCDFAGHSTCAQPLPPPYCFSSCLPIPLEALPYQIHVHKPWAQDLFLKTIPKQFSKEAEKREAGVGWGGVGWGCKICSPCLNQSNSAKIHLTLWDCLWNPPLKFALIRIIFQNH